MGTQTFIIKSLLIQNGIMLVSLGIVVAFLGAAIYRRRLRLVLAALLWTGGILWFFNSPYFGFSAVSVGAEGVRLHYGVLSIRKDLFPIHSPWTIETVFSGIRKTKKVYLIHIGDRNSMRVSGEDGRHLLETIGAAIDRGKMPR